MFKENGIFKNMNLIHSVPLPDFQEILSHQNQKNQPTLADTKKVQVAAN